LFESSWPVVCSPVVREDTVFAAAGRSAVPGGYVVALDVETGAPRWQRSFVPYSGNEPPPYAGKYLTGVRDPDINKTWISPHGELALDGDRLFVRTYNSTGPSGLVLDARTGANTTKQNYYDYSITRERIPGAQMAILPGGLILSGSYSLDMDQNVGPKNVNNLGIAVIDPDGSVRGLTIRLYDNPNGFLGQTVVPCWLGNTLVVPQFSQYGLVAYDLAAWRDEIASLCKPGMAESPKRTVRPLWGPFDVASGTSVKNAWSKMGNAAYGVVVGQDAALTTSTVVVPMPDGPYKGDVIKAGKIVGGKISAFATTTGGALRWTVELPAAPALDALSLDRDGNALVGLQDGSVVSVGAR